MLQQRAKWKSEIFNTFPMKTSKLVL